MADLLAKLALPWDAQPERRTLPPTMAAAPNTLAMDAVVSNVADGTIAKRRVPRPVPVGNQMLCRCLACGICGTDLHSELASCCQPPTPAPPPAPRPPPTTAHPPERVPEPLTEAQLCLTPRRRHSDEVW